MSCIKEIYCFLEQHDLPNWICLILTSLIWPLAFYIWNTKPRKGISNFKIGLSSGSITIDNENASAVIFTLTNSTNNTIFISNMRIRINSHNFKIHKKSSKDFYSGYLELKFLKNNEYIDRDTVIYTNQQKQTALALEDALNNDFIDYQPDFYRKHFGCPKYFTLRYTALVGERRIFVKSKY